MTADEAKRYHRTIEEAWGRLRERPGLLSPREFAVVEGWRQRGIPAGLVVEVFDERRKKGAAPRSIAYLSRAVDEAWSAIAAGRVAVPAPTAEGARRPEDAWSAALERAEAPPSLRMLVTRLLASLDRGADAGALDAELDEALPRLAPPALLDEAERETAKALAPFRGRMAAPELARTRMRARNDRLRAALGFPRLR